MLGSTESANISRVGSDAYYTCLASFFASYYLDKLVQLPIREAGACYAIIVKQKCGQVNCWSGNKQGIIRYDLFVTRI